MLPIAEKYIAHLGHGEAVRRFVADLMAGDPENFKAGYSRENAVIATAEAFSMTNEQVEDLLS